MDERFERLLRKIGITDLAPFEKGFFKDLKNEKESNSINALIYFPTYLPYASYEQFFDGISDFTLKTGISMKISFTYQDERINFPRLLEEFKHAKNCTLMDDIYFYENENKILFYYTGAEKATILTDELRKLNDFLDSISSSYNTLIQEKVTGLQDFSKQRDEKYEAEALAVSQKFKKQELINSTYQPCKLKDVDKFKMVIVAATIFKIEDTKIKGKNARNIWLYDGSDSIKTTLFESSKMSYAEIDQYKVGEKVKIHANTAYFDNQITLRIDKIEMIDKDPIRMDEASEKRVELHLHSKMSTMDGVCEFKDYADLAKKWGHKAIALTDHGCVHAFPNAQKVAKDIKVIYGSELYMVDDTPRYIFNPDDKRELRSATYVVFDIETTGLSARFDRLIEFGAVKIDAMGTILDEIDFFVNPDRALSKFSLEVSHITQEQVDHGKPIKKALKDIKEFFSDCILVAHNAGGFDYEFLNEIFRINGMEGIKNPVIDTLPLSLYFYPNKKSHSEAYMARQLDIPFDEISAHRADYDATVLAKIFQIYLSDLMQKHGFKTHADIGKLPFTEEMLVNSHAFHTTCYVKTQAGLKELYKIISASEIKWLSNVNGNPLVPKSLLAEHRENLLFGSACLNGEIFETAMIKSTEVLKKKLEFYDIIEVQPPENYIYLINKGQLNSLDDVKGILSYLIETAKSMGKIVCATGDCHYLNPEDKFLRDIIIQSPGLKNARHPLNLAPYESAPLEKKKAYYKKPFQNPDQHFRTTTEMLECFSFLKDEELIKEIVITNTNKVADMIDENIEIVRNKLFAPKIEGNEEHLTELVYTNAKKIYGDPLPKVIADRIEQELHGIISNGYSVIYWISSLLVRWSNEQGYMVGSRGSVGSSLVATMAGITEVNPLPPHYICPKCHHLEWPDSSVYGSGYDLPEKDCPECGEKLKGEGQNIPFATFLGFSAEKVPDIDLNFPTDFQSNAQNHLKDLLGKDHVYKAGTIQTIQEKNADKIVRNYFDNTRGTSSDIRDAEIDRLAGGLVEIKRTTGQHPGGVIVIPQDMDIFDFTPIQYPGDKVDSDWTITHFEYKAIHDSALKFDVLGHVDPQAVKMMCDLCGISFNDVMEKVPLNDKEALSLFWSNEALHLKDNVLNEQTGALGLPEFGTPIGRRNLIETKPSTFSDLVRISGLSHGTGVFEGNAKDLILLHDFTLKDVIACRDDIMTTLHEKYGIDNKTSFDIMEFVRKDGRFGKPEFKEKHDEYVKLMKEHGVPDYYIESCEKINYLFPKGHAVAYVTMAVRCAYFKVHHPLEYYATYFTLRCDAYELETMCKGLNASKQRLAQIQNLIKTRRAETNDKKLINSLEQTIEMYDRGYKFSNISVNHSLATNFSVDHKSKSIIPAFSAVPGLAKTTSEQIVTARLQRPFSSVEDFRRRAKVPDKILDELRKLHAFEGLPESEQISLFDF